VARHLTDSDLKRIFKAAADEGLNRGLVKLDDVQVVVAINNNIVSSLGLQLS